MRKLELLENKDATFYGRYKKSFDFSTMGQYLFDSIKIGSEISISSDNTRLKSRSGKYYLLFMDNFYSFYLLYVGSDCQVRVVYNGMLEDVSGALYRNVPNDTVVKVLRSGPKTNRVYIVHSEDDLELVPMQYKNKSSEKVEMKYLDMWEAIQLANYCTTAINPLFIYSVRSPKGTEFFRI